MKRWVGGGGAVGTARWGQHDCFLRIPQLCEAKYTTSLIKTKLAILLRYQVKRLQFVKLKSETIRPTFIFMFSANWFLALLHLSQFVLRCLLTHVLCCGAFSWTWALVLTFCADLRYPCIPVLVLPQTHCNMPQSLLCTQSLAVRHTCWSLSSYSTCIASQIHSTVSLNKLK